MPKIIAHAAVEIKEDMSRLGVTQHAIVEKFSQDFTQKFVIFMLTILVVVVILLVVFGVLITILYLSLRQINNQLGLLTNYGVSLKKNVSESDRVILDGNITNT